VTFDNSDCHTQFCDIFRLVPAALQEGLAGKDPLT